MEYDKQHEAKDSSQPTTTPQSRELLARLGISGVSSLSEASVEQLLATLRDQRWEMRASAVTALGKIRASIPVDALITALQDNHESVRMAAARALGRLAPFIPVPISSLLQSLQDSSPLVREAVVTTLGKTGTDIPADSLVVLLRDEHESVRAASAQALGRLRCFVSPSVLAEALHDSSFLVREAAAQALGMRGDIHARRFLLPHIQDKEITVRDAVAQALFQLESGDTQKFLWFFVQEQEESMQKVVRYVLTKLVDLGLDIHEGAAPIVSLKFGLQSFDRVVEKTITFYLIGRALDTLNERTLISPLIDMLCVSHGERSTSEGIWRALFSLAEKELEERRKIRILMNVKSDPNTKVQIEIKHALECLIALALHLQEEQSDGEYLRTQSLNGKNTKFEDTVRLLRESIRVLEERESLDLLFHELSRSDADKRAKASKVLARRAKKALMGSMPPGSVVFSLRGAQGLSPIELKLGTRESASKEDGRVILPFYGTKLPSRRRASKSSWLEAYAGVAMMGLQRCSEYLES